MWRKRIFRRKKGVADLEKAINGAKDIIAEAISR